MTDRYEILMDPSESILDIKEAAAGFWRGYPEYRGAIFSVRRRKGPAISFLVEAIFSNKWKGEFPASVDVEDHILNNDDRRSLEKEVRAMEKHLDEEWEEEGIHRVVFLHPNSIKAHIFCEGVVMFQDSARAEFFRKQTQGDGSAETQWGEVFGGGVKKP